MKPLLEQSIRKVEKWVEDHDYKGYEPFDGLSSYLRPLAFRNLFLERVLQQLGRQNPINLRPLLGVKPLESTKGQWYMACGYLNMFKLSGDNTYMERAFRCLAWLDDNKAPKYANHSWGNHFEYVSRGGRIPKYEPTIVWTSLIGQAFLDAYEVFGKRRHLEIIDSIRTWILSLPKERTGRGTCLSYVAYEQSSIHNSNMLGAAFLAGAARLKGDKVGLDEAREAMEYSCSRQLENGAWYYGEDPKYHWVDNFHTGYNLDSLKRYVNATSEDQHKEKLLTGYRFFRNHFFEDGGRPKYYHNRAYPIDIQCASQAIETLTEFSDLDSEALPLACKVAAWTIDNMQDHDGHFYYRIYPSGIKAKAPMIHWGQATTYKALASLLLKLNSNQG
jgi:rhamnogalacturonyl hydrolase YesR